MNVISITNGITVRANSVYIIPPNHNLSMIDRRLHLLLFPVPRSGNLPIDIFFSALAQDQADNAVVIILSGTGSDGSQGLKEIKAVNGLVIVQDQTAKYDGMPRNAIATEMVDFVLSPDKIPEKLIHYSQQSKDSKLIEGKNCELHNTLHKIILLISKFSLLVDNCCCRLTMSELIGDSLSNVFCISSEIG